MSAYRWQDCTRLILNDVLPEALVVLPIGAIEQHGPHLPSGTDTFAVEAVAGEAARRAAAGAARDIVVAPTLPFGASDHHFIFGGTLSLTAETVTAMLVDLVRSIGQAGASRLLIVNGHGGNRGPCHSAAQIASTRYGIHAAYIDYWSLAPEDPSGIPVPGHAGAFETSLIRHLHPDIVGSLPPARKPPDYPDVEDVVLHTETIWRTLNGYTDNPTDSGPELGARWFEACASALGARIVSVAASL